MEDDLNQPVVELTDYLAIIKRRKLLILACILLTGLAALLLSQLGSTTYSATVRVIVEPINVDNLGDTVSPARQIDPGTEVGIVRSPAVAARVIAAQDFQQSPNSLLNDIEVASTEESQLMRIRCTRSSASQARNCAYQFAVEYRNFRNESAKALFDPEIGSLTTQRTALQTEIDEAELAYTQAIQDLNLADDGDAAAENQADRAANELNRLNNTVNDLNKEIGNLESKGNLDYVQILEAGESAENVRVSEQGTNLPLNVLIGLVLGGIIGVGLAFLRDRTDDTLKDSGESLERMGIRLLTAIPRPGSAIVRRRGEGAVEDADSAISEAHRRLRSNVMFLANRDNTRVLLVTSPHAESGITTVCANLGVSLARAGKRVLIVSAALRKSTMHDLFRLPNTRGLSNVLQQPGLADDVIQSALGMSHLGVLVAGPTVDQPAELLSRTTFGALLRTQLEKYDIIIIEGPPVLTFSDALAVAPYSDGVLLVVDNETTTRTDVRNAIEQLRAVGGSILGGVLLNSHTRIRKQRTSSSDSGSGSKRLGRKTKADDTAMFEGDATAGSSGANGTSQTVDAGTSG
jgi:capsular exopolysaccharide synthesis family protein